MADFDDPADVKVVALDDACRRQQVGEGHFAGLADVPTHALTVTTPAGDKVFEGEAGGVFKLLSELDRQYRDWLAGPAAGPIDQASP